ncbi:unnamed protein product, partial [Prunus brigantina]
CPAQDPNWGKGPPGKPKRAPAREKKPGQELGPTNPGRSKGKFRLGFSPSFEMSTHGNSNFFYR